MRVYVKVFAVLKDFFDPEFQVEIPESSTVSDLRNRIMLKSPFSLPVLQQSRFAVGESFVQENHIIKENEWICILPPSSGG